SPTGPTTAARPPAPPSTAEDSPSADVRGYTTSGGRVTFALRPDHASLVSATPESGWRVQVWKQDLWIRVTFSRGDRSATVFCTWHDSAPRVQLDERRD
ncbi:hypothetical protein GL263_17895, partial [Streptomyces durbertensis]|nr:hypothetical protein [Streptomyces durbertensis]